MCNSGFTLDFLFRQCFLVMYHLLLNVLSLLCAQFDLSADLSDSQHDVSSFPPLPCELEHLFDLAIDYSCCKLRLICPCLRLRFIAGETELECFLMSSEQPLLQSLGYEHAHRLLAQAPTLD